MAQLDLTVLQTSWCYIAFRYCALANSNDFWECKNATDSGSLSAFEICQRSERLLTCYTAEAAKVEQKSQLRLDF